MNNVDILIKKELVHLYFRRKEKIATGDINIITEKKELYALVFHYLKEKDTHSPLRMRDVILLGC